MKKNNVLKIRRSNLDLKRFVEFTLGLNSYAIPLFLVKEIISAPETTVIPKSPAYFLGMMNLRGQIIPIVDLRKKLKIEVLGKIEEAVIVVDINGVYVGIVVDCINKVLAFYSHEIYEMPEIENKLNTQYILGVYNLEETIVVLLDILKVIDLNDLETINQAV